MQGNIGALILSKFKVLLDYGRERVILEPNASLTDLIGAATSGVLFIAEGSDYKSFRIEDLLEDSQRTDAGLRKDDVILAIDGRPAAELTLSLLRDTFEKPQHRKLTRLWR